MLAAWNNLVHDDRVAQSVRSTPHVFSDSPGIKIHTLSTKRINVISGKFSCEPQCAWMGQEEQR